MEPPRLTKILPTLSIYFFKILFFNCDSGILYSEGSARKSQVILERSQTIDYRGENTDGYSEMFLIVEELGFGRRHTLIKPVLYSHDHKERPENL